MIAIITVATYVKQTMITKWLKGDPNIPPVLVKDPVWEKITNVYAIESQTTLLDVLEQYKPDTVLLDNSILSDPIALLAQIYQKFPDTRIVIITGKQNKDNARVIDFCIDNGIYDIITEAASQAIKQALFVGFSKSEVEHLRSSNSDKIDVSKLVEEINTQEEYEIEQQRIPIIKNFGDTKFISVFSMKSVGKTTTAVNTGIAMGMAGLKVLVVDVNVVTPDVGAYLGIRRGTPGIERYFAGSLELYDLETIIHTMYGIDIIPMGSLGEMSAVAMETTQVERLISGIAENFQYDIVLFDLSPVLDNAANRMFIRKSDMVLLVINQVPATVENMYNQIAKIQSFCDKSPDQMKLILNNYQDSGISPSKIKNYLNVEIVGRIPLDLSNMIQSVKLRTPYVVEFPKKIKPFNEVARKITGRIGTPILETTERSGLLSKIKSALLRR